MLYNIVMQHKSIYCFLRLILYIFKYKLNTQYTDRVPMGGGDPVWSSSLWGFFTHTHTHTHTPHTHTHTHTA